MVCHSPVLRRVLHLVSLAPCSPSFPPVSPISLFGSLCWFLLFSLISKCCSNHSLFLSVLLCLLTFLCWSRRVCLLALSVSHSQMCIFGLISLPILQAAISSFLLSFPTYHVSNAAVLDPFHLQPPPSQFDGSLLVVQAAESLGLFSFSHIPHLI